jgi:hypothetical protein
LFQEELDALVDVLGKSGWLFVFRNHIPRALLGDWAVLLRGTQAHCADDPIREDARGLRERGEAIRRKRKRVTLVIPMQEREWVKRAPPPLSWKERPTPPVQSEKTYADIGEQFYRAYEGTGALREFDPHKKVNNDLERRERERLGLSGSELPVTNFLPDIWVAFSGSAISRVAGTATDDRRVVEDQFISWVAGLGQGRKKPLKDMRSWLMSGDLRIIQISGAQFANAQYFGQRVGNEDVALRLLKHGALTCILSDRL